MAGHVNNAQPVAAGEVQVGKSQLNGDTPLFFLFQTVGFNTGQGPDQAGLAMVDMAGSAEDDFTHGGKKV